MPGQAGAAVCYTVSAAPKGGAGVSYQLPPHLFGDLLAAFAYGLLTIALVILGFKVFDWLTPRLNVQEELGKNHNVATAIVIASIVLGICYAVSQVVVHFITS
jgi:putative membrane protein